MSVLQRFSNLVSAQKQLPSPVNIKEIESARLKRCYVAGLKIESILQELSAEGKSLIEVVLNKKKFEKWEMYPWDGGILDQRTSSQYFYHSHVGYKGEHGHFHSFYYHQRKLAHLIAIGITKKGQINKLYTFNRWSPGDHYFPARRLKTFLPKFNISKRNQFNPRIHEFVNQVHILFAAEIEWLFDERDETFDRYRKQNDGQSPYEDRSLEITSELIVDVEAKLSQLKNELLHRSEPLPELAVKKVRVPDQGVQSNKKAFLKSPELDNQLSEKTLKLCHEAGIALQEIKEQFRQSGTNVVTKVMNHKPFEEWEVYPWEDGIIDNKNKSQYFYHSHPQSPEHGHFHIFKRHAKKLVHLIAVAMDDNGEPIELFTVNTWVTGEKVLAVEKIKNFVREYRIETNKFDSQVNDYITQIVKLYQPEIEQLLDQRERVYAVYRDEHDGSDPYEDRSLEITSTLKIDIEQKLQQLGQLVDTSQD